MAFWPLWSPPRALRSQSCPPPRPLRRRRQKPPRKSRRIRFLQSALHCSGDWARHTRCCCRLLGPACCAAAPLSRQPRAHATRRAAHGRRMERLEAKHARCGCGGAGGVEAGGAVAEQRRRTAAAAARVVRVGAARAPSRGPASGGRCKATPSAGNARSRAAARRRPRTRRPAGERRQPPVQTRPTASHGPRTAPRAKTRPRPPPP